MRSTNFALLPLFWFFGASAAAEPQFSFDGTTERLVAAGDILVATPFLAGTVRAVLRGGGKVLWSHETDGGANATPIVQGKDVLYAEGNGRLRVVDARSGAIHHERKLPGRIVSDLTVSDSTVWVSLSGSPGALVALDRRTLQPLWRFVDDTRPDGDFKAPAIVDGDDVFVVSNEGRLYRLARSNGKERASVNLAPRARFRSVSGDVPAIAVVGKRLVVFLADEDSPSQIVFLDRERLSVEGALQLGKSYHGRLETHGDRVLLWEDGGPQHSAALALFDPERRRELWRFDSGKASTVATTVSTPLGLFALWGCGYTLHDIRSGAVLQRSVTECPTTMTSNPVREGNGFLYARSDPKLRKSELWTIALGKTDEQRKDKR